MAKNQLNEKRAKRVKTDILASVQKNVEEKKVRTALVRNPDGTMRTVEY